MVEGRITRLTPPSDEHGGYEGNIYDALRSFVRPRQLGKVRVGGVDVLYISNERYATKGNNTSMLRLI